MKVVIGQIACISILAGFVLACCIVQGQTAEGPAEQEWHYYGRDPGGMRYSPLRQIDRDNVDQLRRAWAYQLPSNPSNRVIAFESTPLMIDDALYFATQTGQAIALDAETGKQLWLFDPYRGSTADQGAVPNRGVAYWEGEAQTKCGREAGGVDRRIFYTTPDAHLFSLDAATGKPCPGFGDGGSINLRDGVATAWPKNRYDVTSPPVIYKNLIITGSELQESPSKGPSGDIRAFDVQTGKLVWRFHTVPRPGEAGHNTWADDGWKDRSGTNAWGLISIDIKNGLVFLPLGQPSYDFYGADRKGEGLFGDSLVALKADSGKLVWYYQLVHHDLWDYDLTAQPLLMTVRRDGREVPAVAEVTKTGYIYVFNRLTGKPLFPIEERPVPKSEIPGEASWPTQPIPVAPPHLLNSVVTKDDITDVTPESRKYCLDTFGSILPSQLFDPWGFTLKLDMPGTLGGSNWSGASYDPTTDNLYVNFSELGTVGEMKREPPGSPEAYRWDSPWGTYARFWDPQHHPCQKPPWGSLDAVNLNTGKIVWSVPLGVFDDLQAKGVPKTGIYNLGGSIVTAGGLVFVGATSDHRLRAFDSQTGKELWVADLESNGRATPLTYVGSRTKRQFVVIAIGPGGNLETGGSGPTALVAYAILPKGQPSPVMLVSEGAGAEAGSEPATLTPPPPAPVQPVSFSHKQHVSIGMRCEDCHQLSKDGTQMQVPNVKECMTCHKSVAADNPIIQKLAQMEKEDQTIAWKPVYQLPGFVFFSHQKHIDAKIGCAVCHGDVHNQDVMAQEKAINMASCVNCHRLHKASTTCGLCHTVGY